MLQFFISACSNIIFTVFESGKSSRTMSFECNHCPDKFSVLRQYLKHVKDVHIENDEAIQCNIGACSEKNWTFTCKSTFGNHVYSHHKFATGTSKISEPVLRSIGMVVVHFGHGLYAVAYMYQYMYSKV